MSIELQRKTVNVAPVNLNPEEETVIRQTFESVEPQSAAGYTYSLKSNARLKEAEILIANLASEDLDKTNQLLKRVYGVKTTIFVAEKDNIPDETQYKYIVPRDRLNDTLLTVLDEASNQELEITTTHAPPPSTLNPIKQQPTELNATQKYFGRVLIVDDSPSVRTQMKLYLSKHKFKCYVAENAEEAVRAVKNIDFDIIFLDVIMPGVDGYQACKAIKSLLGSRQVPVILLTSKSSPVDKIHGIMSGCDKYLTKPVRSSELKEILGSYFPKLKRALAKHS